MIVVFSFLKAGEVVFVFRVFYRPFAPFIVIFLLLHNSFVLILLAGNFFLHLVQQFHSR